MARGGTRFINGKTVAVVIAALVSHSSAVLAQGQPPSAVYVDEVVQETVQQQRMITGNIRSPRHSNLATQEAGIVLEVLVREGEHVEAGQLVARLDNRRLELQIAHAEADLLVLRATVQERNAELSQRENDLSLMRGAFERNAANPRELRDAESALAIASARMVAAERSAEATEALIALWRERLDDTHIRAPYEGMVIAKFVDAGEWLAEGDAVIEMIASDTVEAWLEVPQENLPAARSMNRVITLRSEATGQLHTSQHYRVVPRVDSRARTFMLVVTLDNEDGSLAPGQSVLAWVPMTEKSEQLTVPKNAVLRNQIGSFVYVARAQLDGTQQETIAVPAQVRLLFPIGDRWVVQADGLRAGELVIVEGNERLFPMSRIRPIRVEVKGVDHASATVDVPAGAAVR